MRLANHLWDRFGALTLDDVPPEARVVAGHCVLDWFGCALAGSREPLSGILRDELGAQAGPCSIVGTDLHCAPGVAALVNGAAGHALDFDDTHGMMGGHPTVPVFPAALAQAQAMGASGERLLVAFIVGLEVESRVGALVGPAPYAKGWHSTSTIGVYGAAAAACRLLGANNEQFGRALGLAASQAGGLKANFGTMTKPFHAGHAAERGLLSARLAMRGFTSNPEALDGRQGYADAAASGRDAVDWERLEEQDGRFLIEDTLFKYHAACYLTHAAIESVGRLRLWLASAGVSAGDVEKAIVTVHPGLLDVCGIPEPRTGLEAKFSLTATTSLAMLGIDTTDTGTFVDETLDRPDVARMIDRVEVRTDRGLGNTQARVELRANGRSLEEFHDSGLPATDLEAQGVKLAAKMTGLTAPLLGAEASARLRDLSLHLASVDEVSEITGILAGSREAA
ncbi:MAG: MmgE/PrpD family protein [Acidobacteriota bacterium]|nr:MmgE/PrpD family protein [Acidobacteriota bacterium]MDE3265356.1 MmgE/PrpD family protein [Acidobacteriota bacterium]